MEHPKSKNKGWNSNSEFDSITDKHNWSHQVFHNFFSCLILTCLSSSWESGNQHIQWERIFFPSSKPSDVGTPSSCTVLFHSSVPHNFKLWNSIAKQDKHTVSPPENVFQYFKMPQPR